MDGDSHPYPAEMRKLLLEEMLTGDTLGMFRENEKFQAAIRQLQDSLRE